MGGSPMSDTQHTHPNFHGTGQHLEHDHHRGYEGHTHSEEIELVIAKLLKARDYTGLTPLGQRVVARGIAAMRQGLVIVSSLSDATAERYPPPSTEQLRAPLITRRKHVRQEPSPSPSKADPWTISNTAKCLICKQSTRRRTNPDTGVQYGPAVIFHLDECPDRPIGRRA